MVPPRFTCWPFLHSIIHTDLKPENVLLDLPPRPPPDSEQPPPLQGRVSKAGMALKGVATTIEDLNTALSLADQNGMSAEEKRKLKKKVRTLCIWHSAKLDLSFSSSSPHVLFHHVGSISDMWVLLRGRVCGFARRVLFPEMWSNSCCCENSK